MTSRKAMPLRLPLAAIAVFATAAVLRIAVAVPGLYADKAERFSRPDTPGYLGMAAEFAVSGTLSGTGRVPVFPLFSSLFCDARTGECDWRTLVAALTLCGALAATLVFYAGALRSFGTGVAAGMLYAFNLTAVVNSPMLLSDTLFGVMTALQFLFFMLFWQRKLIWSFFPMVLIAALGVLVRPVNLLWIFPALALLLLDFGSKLTWRRKLVCGFAGAVLFLAVVTPWMFRNAARGAGFTPDTNTGAVYHQNGAMLAAEINGTDFESEKSRLLKAAETEFADTARYPDEASREAWRLRRYREMVLEHPLVWLRQSCSWRMFLPDAPTFWELCGITDPGRGTMGVMAKHGFVAGVRHYFEGNLKLLIVTVALLIPTLVLYLCALGRVVCDICLLRSRWYELVMLLAFAEYYLLLPGAITAPRYQIPALPVLCVLAALFMLPEAKKTPAAPQPEEKKTK